MLGSISLPGREVISEYSQKWRDREGTLGDDVLMIWFQGDYVKELISEIDYQNFDVEGINKTFIEWEHHKYEDIMGFRNNAYGSLMTGNMQPVHQTSWMEPMDDSMGSYLKG